MAERSAGGSSASRARSSTAEAVTAAQDEARRQFESTRDVLMEQGDQAYRRARTSVLSAAEQQKQRAAEGMEGVARSLHDMARNLNSQDQALPARYTDLAAEGLERAAHALQEKTVNDLMNDAEEFARRQPAVFLGGAFVVGLLVARFLKSSETGDIGSSDDASMYGSDDVGVGMGYGTRYGSRAGADTTGYGEDNLPGGGI